MKQFDLCIEEEVKVVKRTTVVIDAETKEEAVKKVKELGSKCNWMLELSDEEDVFVDSEILADTVEPMSERKISIWEEGSNEEENFIVR